jgi:paraquat-inducible protein B
MSEAGETIPEAQLQAQRGFRMIWLIPIVALLAGAWLGWQTLSSRGPGFEINFRVAHGIVPGKTVIRYRDVEVGIVEAVDVSSDLSYVVVEARVNPLMGKHLVEGTRFWVVRPRVGAGGISGLSTLISGAYIGMDVGPEGGREVRSFRGIEIPPIDVAGERGLSLELETSALKGIGSGSPIFYRNINVGEVIRYELDPKDPTRIQLHVLVHEKFASLVNSGTRFWNASGLDVAVGLDGVTVDVESIQSLLIGGIAFDTVAAKGAVAEKGAHYEVYASRQAAVAAVEEVGGLRFVLDAAELGSIEVGDAVTYREERVGRVVDQSLHDDSRSVGILVEIDRRYAPLVRTNSVFWNASGISGGFGLGGVTVHTESLEALLRGGVAFATPDRPGARAKSGSVFSLHSEAQDGWRGWAPRIWIGRGRDPAALKPSAAAAPEKEERVSPLSKSGRTEGYGGLMRHRGMKR